MTVGLRFHPTDARRLREIAQRIRAGELGKQHVGLFDKAADAAQTGEPLIVQCTDPVEAIVMADAFPSWGVGRPVVEELNSSTHSRR
jgi:hypothetical protein